MQQDVHKTGMGMCNCLVSFLIANKLGLTRQWQFHFVRNFNVTTTKRGKHFPNVFCFALEHNQTHFKILPWKKKKWAKMSTLWIKFEFFHLEREYKRGLAVIKQYGKFKPLFLIPDQCRSKSATSDPLLLLQSSPLLSGSLKHLNLHKTLRLHRKHIWQMEILWFSQH